MDSPQDKTENPQDKSLQIIREQKQLYLTVFDNPDGKALLNELSIRAFEKRTTFNKDSHQTAFNEGQRSIVLHIKNMLILDVDKLERSMKAQQKQQGGDNVE